MKLPAKRACGLRRAAPEPPQIARVKIGRFRAAITVDDGRQRAAFGMREPERHVTVWFGITRGLGRFEQCIECWRWLDRNEPVTLIDRAIASIRCIVRSGRDRALSRTIPLHGVPARACRR